MSEDLLTAARNSMHGLVELDATLPRLQKAANDVRSLLVPVVDVETVLEEIIAGADIPDLGAEILTMQERIKARNQQIEMLQSMLTSVNQRRLEIHRTRADDALAYLAGQLDPILTAARSLLTDLQEVTSAEEAIDRGRTDEWSTTGQLATRYAELRHAQAVIVTAALFPLEDWTRVVTHPVTAARAMVGTFGTLKNYGDLYPEPGAWWELADSRQQNLRRHDSLGNAVPPAPWLTDDPRANLAYIAGPKSDPWVPSIEELQAAVAAREQQHATGLEGSAPLRFGERAYSPPSGRTRDLLEMAREHERRETPARGIPPIDVP